MALKGDLASVDLSQVFQMLALNQKVGLLRIQAPGTSKALYFDQRGVTLSYNEHLLLDKVLVTLARTGELPSTAVQDAREHAASRGISVIDSLLAGGYLSPQSYEQALRGELVEEIYDLFFWREARFEFFEGQSQVEGVEGIISPRFFFSTDSLIMEAARRIDEWSYIEKCVPGEDVVFRSLKRANVIDLGDAELAVMDLVDGKRNVARLIEITGMRPFQVCKALAILSEEEAIAPLPSADLVAAANECINEGRHQDAINLLERAVVEQVGHPDTHGLLASVYESSKEYASAGFHLKSLAEFHVSQGEFPRAIELLRHVIAMLPTDLQARERLIEIEVGMAEVAKDPATLAEGRLLVELYLEIGELERVQRILEGMLRQNPHNFELKKSLVNVHTRAGNTKRVIELYESIAQDLLREKRPIEAVGYLQKILMIDRSRRDVTDRIKALYELDERRRSRRRSLALLGSLFLVISAMCGVWYFYEQYALEHFERLDVTELVAVGDYEACSNVYESFQKSYPLTMAAREADAKLAWIESLRLAADTHLRHEKLKQQTELEGLRERYRAAWDRHEALFQARNVAGSVQSLEMAKKLVAAAGEPSDLRWAQRVKLEKSLHDLRDYLATATRVRARADAALREGRWQDARQDLLLLVGKYDMAEESRDVLLPVLLDSHPSGAAIVKDGEALYRGEEAERQPLRTPAVVFCSHGRPNEFELRLDGFRAQKLAIDARKSAEVSLVLTVLPRVRIAFDSGIQSASAASGFIAVGLQGGRVGIASADGKNSRTVELGGLTEVDGRAAITAQRSVLRTNDGQIVAFGHDAASPDWSVRLSAPAAEDPTLRDGRVVVGDTAGNLVCLRAASGEQLWVRQLGSPVAGAVEIQNRSVFAATRAGRLVVLDAVDGTERANYELPASPSTGPVATGDGDRFLIGTGDSVLRLIDGRDGRQVWKLTVGGPLQNGQVLVVGASAIVLAGTELWSVGLADGARRASRPLPGRRIAGPVTAGGMVGVVVRQKADKQSVDLLMALDAGSLEVQWEYIEHGAVSALATDGATLYLANTDKEVICFR